MKNQEGEEETSDDSGDDEDGRTPVDLDPEGSEDESEEEKSSEESEEDEAEVEEKAEEKEKAEETPKIEICHQLVPVTQDTGAHAVALRNSAVVSKVTKERVGVDWVVCEGKVFPQVYR